MKTVLITLFGVLLTVSTWAKNHSKDPNRKFKKWETSLVTSHGATQKSSSQGMVYVSFNLTDRGVAENIEVLKGMDSHLNARAVELVKSMPKEHLYANGFIEGTRFILPIRFSVE